LPIKPRETFITNAVIVEMKFFGIPTKNLLTANARNSVWMDANIIFVSGAIKMITNQFSNKI